MGINHLVVKIVLNRLYMWDRGSISDDSLFTTLSFTHTLRVTKPFLVRTEGGLVDLHLHFLHLEIGVQREHSTQVDIAS